MKSIKKIVLLAMLLTFTSAMYASSINCAVDPSDQACAPTLTMTVQVGNGQTQTVTSAGTPVFSSGSWNVDFGAQSFGGFQFNGGALQANSDPFVGFSIGATNHSGHTVTVSFDYVTPYSGGPYGFAQTVYGDVLIDTNFSGQSTMHPVGGAYIMKTYDTGHLISALDIGKGCTTPKNVFVCTSPDIGAIGPLHYTSFANGNLEVKGAFTVTNGAQYSITARSALLPIPEPGTLVLLGSSLIGLAGFARRRMSK